IQGWANTSTFSQINQTVKSYVCPADPTVTSGGSDGWSACSSYVYNGILFQADWNGYRNFPASIPDGTSNTIFVTETYSAANNYGLPWGAPLNGSTAPYAPGTYGGDHSIYWWDYNSFQTPPTSNGDCGGLNFYGPNFGPLIKPLPSYCGNNAIPWTWGGGV